MLIIMGSKLYYTASGIITPVGGRPVNSARNMYCNIIFCVLSWLIAKFKIFVLFIFL